MDKLEKINSLLELLKNDTITPKELEQFLVMVLDVIKKSKESFDQISEIRVQAMTDALDYIEKEHKGVIEKLDRERQALLTTIQSEIKKVRAVADEIRAYKPKDGEDGQDADEEYVIEEVTKRVASAIVLPDDSGEAVVSKINELPIDDPELLIDASHIKNLPVPKGFMAGGVRFASQLADVAITNIQNNDVLKWNSTLNRFENGAESGGGAWGSITGTLSDQTDLQSALDAKVDDSEKGANNGVATLDSGGKVPASQLPNTVMEYQGTWNANTNSPSLADGTGNNGDVYLVTTAGTRNLGSGAQTFAIGDWVIYNGSIWQKSINSNAVVSVNGQQGVVTLTKSDVSLGNVTNDVQAKADFSGYSSKATPVDADTTIINDSAASGAVKSLSWSNIKATLKTYFDTLYTPKSTAFTSFGFVWSTGLSAAANLFFSPYGGTLAGSGTEVQRQAAFSAGTIKNLRVHTGASQSGTGSLVVTVSVNSSLTSVVATVTAGGGAGTYTSGSNSVAINAGDLVSFNVVNNASATSVANVMITCELYP